MSAGKVSRLADSEFCKLVAEAFVAGCSREQMCQMFDVRDRHTITRWRRDPRVKAHAMKMIEDRVIQITRRVDATIEARLEYADKMSIKELLDIRKEFLGGALRQQTEKADHEVTNEAIEALEKDPELMEKLEALLKQSA